MYSGIIASGATAPCEAPGTFAWHPVGQRKQMHGEAVPKISWPGQLGSPAPHPLTCMHQGADCILKGSATCVISQKIGCRVRMAGRGGKEGAGGGVRPCALHTIVLLSRQLPWYRPSRNHEWTSHRCARAHCGRRPHLQPDLWHRCPVCACRGPGGGQWFGQVRVRGSCRWVQRYGNGLARLARAGDNGLSRWRGKALTRTNALRFGI